MMRALVLALLLVGCARSEDGVAVDHLRPPWAPLAGGALVELAGTGFTPGTRVLVGGRESPLVRVVDDTRLELVVPPGERAGDTEIVVLAGDANASARGVFRYSEPPAIASVTPPEVFVGAPSPITVTVHGAGFADEGAGTPVVLVDDVLVEDVTVRDDATLSFAAPAGVAFQRARIEVQNQRGVARGRGYRYTPTRNPSLLAFPISSPFAYVYDPTAKTTVMVPQTGAQTCFYGVLTDDDGALWGSDACYASGWAWGRIDLETQTLVDATVINALYMALAMHQGTRYAIRYFSGTPQFGSLDATGLAFTPIGTAPLPSCCNLGLASDGTTLWIGTGSQLAPIDPATGVLGTAVELPGVTINDLHWFAGTLYALAGDGRLLAVDPDTGATVERAAVGHGFALGALR